MFCLCLLSVQYAQHELHLSDVNYDYLNAVEDLDLNASLFLPFKELEIRDLRANQLVGGLKNQGSMLSIFILVNT